MGTGLIYNGKIPLEQWKEKYEFIRGVWKEKTFEKKRDKKDDNSKK